MHHIFYSNCLDFFHEFFNHPLVEISRYFFVLVALIQESSDEVQTWLDCHAHSSLEDSIEPDALFFDVFLLTLE
jgi:hypothetical protein